LGAQLFKQAPLKVPLILIIIGLKQLEQPGRYFLQTLQEIYLGQQQEQGI
jgi:hypothetical protein